MKNSKIRMICIAGFFLTCIAFSCKTINRADKKYEQLAYSRAIPLYKKALAKDSANTRGWARLGDCYKENNMTEESEQCYARAVQGDSAKSIYKLNYAEMLMSNGKYDEAKKWMDIYIKEEPNDSRAEALASGLSHIGTFLQDNGNYKVEKLNINTQEAEFCPAFYKEGIVFTSSRDGRSKAHANHAWTGKKYYSIYYSKYARTNASASESNPSAGTIDYTSFEEAVVFLRGIQTKYNNASVCFTKNGTEMWLTRNEIEPKNTETWDDVVLTVKIYTSTFIDGRWTQVTPFQYNSDSYKCAHPALNADGTKLCFASDMPGTYGGMDLWECTRTDNGWSLPHNLGPEVNTAGNEIFPTIASDGTVYFSSNGHEGLGGLDIYSTTNSNGVWTKPKNLGAPFNSSDDDFGLIWDSANDIGYFSSNRTHQGYNDDIYSIRKKVIKLNAMVKDKRTNEAIDSVKVRIIETTADIKDTTTPELTETGKDGAFTSTFRPNKSYKLIAERPDYINDTVEVSAADLKAAGDSMALVIPLSSEVSLAGKICNDLIGSGIPDAKVALVDLDTHDTLHTATNKDGSYFFTKLSVDRHYRIIAESPYGDSKTMDTSTVGMVGNTTLHANNIRLLSFDENIVLSKIYYDLNKANIRPDAAVELDKIVALLNKYPDMTIELGAHTDCRASAAYNMRLSQRRAESAVAYIVKTGINRDRLTARGYGESKPVNKCECEGTFMVPCTEEEYQLNRRTEIKILSMHGLASAD